MRDIDFKLKKFRMFRVKKIESYKNKYNNWEDIYRIEQIANKED
jgi:hypothetical protein